MPAPAASVNRRKSGVFHTILAVLACAMSLLIAPPASAETLTVVSGSPAVGNQDLAMTAYFERFNHSENSARLIHNPHPAWTSIAGARWVNVTGEAIHEWGNFVYTKTLELPANAINASVDVEYAVDDCATFSVNNPTSNFAVDTSNPCSLADEHFSSVQHASSVLQAGVNRLRFDVINALNFPNPSGLIFKAVATYELPVDTDGDGVLDSADNCDSTGNADQANEDGDDLGDACDTFDNRDSDGDTISNGGDNCVDVSNADQVDSDADGIGNECDTQDNADSDGDGVQNHADNCVSDANPDQADRNNSGLGDACDADGDEVADAADNCENDANVDQVDTDGDGDGDACDDFDDRDTDSDGVKNGADNCIDNANADQADVDGDGAGDACDAVNDLDLDNDRVNDDVDNCDGVANATQTDTDIDGEGDACDTDDDGDGFPDADDSCATQSGTAANGCPMPTQKPQCLNDGWKRYGTTFRNQGDCVSYIATRTRNQPAGAK